MSDLPVCPSCNGTGKLSSEAHMGLRIAARRKAREMTQEELSRAVRKSRPQIANIEAGRTDIPVGLLIEFAAALDCNPSELLP